MDFGDPEKMQNEIARQRQEELNERISVLEKRIEELEKVKNDSVDK